MEEKDIMDEILAIEYRWNRFKKARNRLQVEFTPKHEAYISMRGRERLIDELLLLIHRLKE